MYYRLRSLFEFFFNFVKGEFRIDEKVTGDTEENENVDRSVDFDLRIQKLFRKFSDANVEQVGLLSGDDHVDHLTDDAQA